MTGRTCCPSFSLRTGRTYGTMSTVDTVKQPVVSGWINSNLRSRISFFTVYNRIRISIIESNFKSTFNIGHVSHPFTVVDLCLQCGNACLIRINLRLQIVNVIIIVFTAYVSDSSKCQCPEKHYPNKIFLHNYLKITLIIYY